MGIIGTTFGLRAGTGFKLFVALLGAGIVMAAAMGLATRISFQQGFLGYLNDLEAQRLAALSTALADLYREQGDGDAGWRFLAGREEEWRRIQRNSGRAFRSTREAGAIREGGVVRERSERGNPAQPPPSAEPSPPPEPGSRTSLLDADGRIVAGNPSPAADAIHQPVVVGGRTVGWVANVPFRELTDAAELTFQRRQTAAAGFIAGLAVLLAGAVAWGLGRAVLAPARQLATATHRLAAGHYDTRVTVGSADALGRLAADFNRLAETLERNEQRRREFMADVSHELRTPLAIMRGELEAIEDGLMPFDRRSLQSLQVEVGTLAKLVDDLHTLAIADVGALSHVQTRVDLAALARAAVDGFSERAATQGLAVSFVGAPARSAASGAIAGSATAGGTTAGELIVDADPDRLHQVFANIFENAARYAGATAGRPVPLTVGCRADGDRIIVEIDDGGPGVAEAAMPRIFDRFYREEGSRNRATGGAGLGLAICRSIVTASGGTIEARRSPLGGLRIQIELPAAHGDGPVTRGRRAPEPVTEDA